MPNPIDPRSLREGESLMLSEEFYTGLKMDVSYRALRASLGFESGDKVATGIKALGNDKIRVFVGDDTLVRSTLELGFGVDQANFSVGLGKELGSGRMRAVDIDLSTYEGWETYLGFLTSGQLPAENAPGASNPTSPRSFAYANKEKLQLKLAGLEVAKSTETAGGNATWTTNQDGSIDFSIRDRHGQVTFVKDAHQDYEAGPERNGKYALLLQDVDSHYLATWEELRTGRPVSPMANADARLDLTTDDLVAIRDKALTHLGQIAPETGNFDHELSRDEVAGYLREHPGGNGLPSGSPGGLDWIRLAQAQNPDAVLNELFLASGESSTKALIELLSFELDTGDPVAPGRITLYRR